MKKNLIKKILSQKIVKYFFWWWIAALIDLSCLYLFVDIFHIYLYLWVVLAFCISFLLWFLYQKYITFINYDKKHVSQWTLFLIFQLTWLWINTLLLYIFVDKFWFYYMYVAVLNKFIIFVWNYTMNNYFNFK
jgi:putative flippase GtrA